MKIVTNVAYTRIQEIGAGEGRNSKVYLVRDEQLAGELVVKEVEKTSFRTPARYFVEAQAVYASRSPNVVPIHWGSQTADLICLAMPHYPKGSLARKLKDGPLPVAEVIRLAQQLCAGAEHIHRAHYVHLDAKPSNVLFDHHGVAQLADFGQAIDVGDSGITTCNVPIYYEYTPPEVFSMFVVSPASDVYQLGLTLYRAVNGETFYAKQRDAADAKGMRAAIENGAFPNGTFLPHVPHALRRAIRKALNTDHAQRQQSATELAEDIARVRADHDWVVDDTSADCTIWMLSRATHAVTEVRRLCSRKRFAIEVWRGEGAKRRRAYREHWAENLSEKEVGVRLTRFFQKFS